MLKIEKIKKVCYTNCMQVFYTWNKQNSSQFLKLLLQNYFNITEYTLQKNTYGKKYILLPNGTIPLHFSITHSKNLLAIAFYTEAIGLDAEYIRTKIPQSILHTFTEQEQKECTTSYNFLKNWTAKESYIKLQGKSILQELKKLSYSNQQLTYCEKLVSYHLEFQEIKNKDDIYILAICTKEVTDSIHLTEIKNIE